VVVGEDQAVVAEHDAAAAALDDVRAVALAVAVAIAVSVAAEAGEPRDREGVAAAAGQVLTSIDTTLGRTLAATCWIDPVPPAALLLLIGIARALGECPVALLSAA